MTVKKWFTFIYKTLYPIVFHHLYSLQICLKKICPASFSTQRRGIFFFFHCSYLLYQQQNWAKIYFRFINGSTTVFHISSMLKNCLQQQNSFVFAVIKQFKFLPSFIITFLSARQKIVVTKSDINTHLLILWYWCLKNDTKYTFYSTVVEHNVFWYLFLPFLSIILY